MNMKELTLYIIKQEEKIMNLEEQINNKEK